MATLVNYKCTSFKFSSPQVHFLHLFFFIVGKLDDIPDSVAGNTELCLYKQQRFQDQFLCIQCNMRRLRRNGSAKTIKRNGSKPQKLTFAKTSGTVAKDRERIYK